MVNKITITSLISVALSPMISLAAMANGCPRINGTFDCSAVGSEEPVVIKTLSANSYLYNKKEKVIADGKTTAGDGSTFTCENGAVINTRPAGEIPATMTIEFSPDASGGLKMVQKIALNGMEVSNNSHVCPKMK